MKQNKTPDPRFADWDLELPPTHNRVTAFTAQQAATTPVTSKSKSNPTDTTNPYLRARAEVLKNYKEWRRNEVLEMERTGDIHNTHYEAFVKEVSDLGDTYMPLCE